MKRWSAPVALVVLWLLLADLLQGREQLFRYWAATPKQLVFLGVHVLGMLGAMAVLVRDLRGPRPLHRRITGAVRSIPMPRTAKWVVGAVLLGELLVITLGGTYYPFADVGMFRYARPASPLPPELVRPIYYYKDDDGTPVPVHLRKQHIWASADLLGWGFNNEYTFSATYHYKGLQANYTYLVQALRKARGIDTLWVGLYGVDFRTRRVWFDPDPVRAMAFNDSARVFYGPLYVPDHQRALLER